MAGNDHPRQAHQQPAEYRLTAAGRQLLDAMQAAE